MGVSRLPMEFKYGDHKIKISVPEQNLLGVLTGKTAPTVPDVSAAVREAMENPIASARLADIVKPGESVAILVSDLTRSWCRSDKMVPVIVDYLHECGVHDEDILIVIAGGSHRAQTAEEHAKLVTPEVLARNRVIEHDCVNDPMQFLGTTSYGTPVSINKAAYDADRLVLTGGIVTHFLAGYGGGMKSILPGIASYKTIMAHHRTSLGAVEGTLNDELRCGRTSGSIFYEEMVEAARMAKPDFLVNTVMNPDGGIGRVVAGDPVLAHLEGARTIDEFFNTPIDRLADIVIASCGGFPKDINFYQTSKTIYNAGNALKPGGTMVLISESRESFGHPLVKQIATQFASNTDRHRHLKVDYDIGKWVGFLITVYAEKFNIVVLSSLHDDEVRAMGMTPAHSGEEALSMALARQGSDSTIYAMPNAASLLPVLVN